MTQDEAEARMDLLAAELASQRLEINALRKKVDLQAQALNAVLFEKTEKRRIHRSDKYSDIARFLREIA